MTQGNDLVGKPISRVDGKYKVTGQAKYAGDFQLKDLVYAVLLQSTITKGNISAIDTVSAGKVPGVLSIITHLDGAQLDSSKTSAFDYDLPIMSSIVKHDRQNIGVVVAESLEAAREAASLVVFKYKTEQPVIDFWEAKSADNGHKPADMPERGMVSDTTRGDFAGAYNSASVKLDLTYTTPKESHNPMEPHATTALWNGGKLTVYDSTQGVFAVQQKLAKVFNIPKSDIRVITKFVGGGFGCKGTPWSHIAIAALAARVAKRPVQLVLDRSQTYGPVGWRPATKQHFKLGADSSGKLVAIEVEGTIETCQYDEFVERIGAPARFLYACANVQTSHRLVRQDIGKPTFMRAPGECTGTYGLGCAMDELAVALNMDPVKLRLINYAEKDEDKNLPYSSKHLRECYERGAELFGWARRNPKPASMRNGSAQVGMGFATATYPAHQFPASAKATIHADGTAVVESGSQDIGTGTYTIMTQIAADTLGLQLDRVKFQLGDTDYPAASVSGGSTTAASVGVAVKSACQALTDKLIALAVADKLSPLANLEKDKIKCNNGKLLSRADESKFDTYVSILQRASLQTVQADGDTGAGQHGFSLHSFGAQFAEVEVDPELKVIRLTRFAGVFDCGRILNAKTARSQFMGGMIMGFGMALHEHTIMDTRYGRTLNADLAEYHLPVHLDIPELQIEWVEHPDDNFNSLGARGIGEIGITGVAAAIANAVYHATGVRVRDLPITLDKLLV